MLYCLPDRDQSYVDRRAQSIETHVERRSMRAAKNLSRWFRPFDFNNFSSKAEACDMSTQTKPQFCPLPNSPRPGPSSRRPPYQEPHLLHTYSHLPSREIHHDVPPLAYHTRAPIGCDLNNGCTKRIERDPRLQEHLDGLCEGLIRYVRRKGSLKKGALVTWRGMLTRYVADVLWDKLSLKLCFIRLDY
jgi:hypothetical protein